MQLTSNRRLATLEISTAEWVTQSLSTTGQPLVFRAANVYPGLDKNERGKTAPIRGSNKHKQSHNERETEVPSVVLI